MHCVFILPVLFTPLPKVKSKQRCQLGLGSGGFHSCRTLSSRESPSTRDNLVAFSFAGEYVNPEHCDLGAWRTEPLRSLQAAAMAAENRRVIIKGGHYETEEDS